MWVPLRVEVGLSGVHRGQCTVRAIRHRTVAVPWEANPGAALGTIRALEVVHSLRDRGLQRSAVWPDGVWSLFESSISRRAGWSFRELVV